jgi:hypothetical protein
MLRKIFVGKYLEMSSNDEHTTVCADNSTPKTKSNPQFAEQRISWVEIVDRYWDASNYCANEMLSYPYFEFCS